MADELREYGRLIEEARQKADCGGIAFDREVLARMITRLADALSSALRERDMIAAVNADWSTYDKGVREAGKAVVEIADQYADHVFDDDLSEAFQALRSALSLIPSNGQEDHG